MSETAAKKDVQKLQRAIVDGLEDVKAHDIRVFNTEQLSPLFERVIVAGGTSNRQTKALAASVRDKVRDAGFPKPRIEGEENGEWIVVDCGAAVAHIMQPAIRQYYKLEEIWGEKPVRLRSAGALPKGAAAKVDKEKEAAALSSKAPAATKKVANAGATAKTAAAKTPAKKAAAKAPAKKAAVKSAPRKTAAPRKRSSGSASTQQTVVVNKPSARAAAKTAKTVAKKAPAKTAARTTAKTTARKASPRTGR